MSFYDANLKALGLHNRYFLADFLRLIPVGKDKIAATKQNGRVVLQRPGAQAVTLENFNGLGALDPESRLFLVMGFGDGSLVRCLAETAQAEHILVYEPLADFFESLLHLENFRELFSDPRLRFVTGHDGATVKQALSHYFYEDPFRLTHAFNFSHIFNPGTEALGKNRQNYEAFTSVFLAELELKMNRVKPNEEDAFWGLLNVLDNYPDYFHAPPLDLLTDVYKAKPGVVVASGPSLKKSLPALKKYRDGLVIFSCDTSLKPLLAEGIVPDFVGTIERLGETTIVFSGMSELQNTPLVAPSLVGPKSLRAYLGPKMTIPLQKGFDDWILGDARFEDLGNAPGVNHLCYVGLSRMGCNPIFLLGQDLSYDPHTGESHAAGLDGFIHQTSADRREINGEETLDLDATGYDDKPRKTTFIWQHFANLYGPLIRRLGGQVFNLMPADYGIPIPMTERRDVEDAFAHFVIGKIDRTEISRRVHSFAADSGRLHATALKSLSRWRAALKFYSAESLKAMRETAEMWRDHDPRVKNLGYEKLYHVFFERLEKELARIRQHDDGLFDRRFLQMIMGSFLGFRIQRAQYKYREERFLDQTLGLIQTYYQTFNLIHLWSARALEALEHHNQQRWKFW